MANKRIELSKGWAITWKTDKHTWWEGKQVKSKVEYIQVDIQSLNILDMLDLLKELVELGYIYSEGLSLEQGYYGEIDGVLLNAYKIIEK